MSETNRLNNTDEARDTGWLRDRIGELSGAAVVSDEASLRDLGLASVDLILLLADIEAWLGVPLEDDDLVAENFTTLAALRELMGRVRDRGDIGGPP